MRNKFLQSNLKFILILGKAYQREVNMKAELLIRFEEFIQELGGLGNNSV